MTPMHELRRTIVIYYQPGNDNHNRARHLLETYTYLGELRDHLPDGWEAEEIEHQPTERKA